MPALRHRADRSSNTHRASTSQVTAESADIYWQSKEFSNLIEEQPVSGGLCHICQVVRVSGNGLCDLQNMHENPN